MTPNPSTDNTVNQRTSLVSVRGERSAGSIDICVRDGCCRPILLNNSTFEPRGSAASVKRKEDRWLGAFNFGLAMLFGADSCRFWFYRAQPLGHSSKVLRGCRKKKFVVSPTRSA